MTPDNATDQRADAIFAALDASEAEDQASEVAADEETVRQIDRLREVHEPGERR